MKLSTIVKAAVTVATICTAGAVIYTKIKKNTSEEVETTTIPDTEEDDEEEPTDEAPVKKSSGGLTGKQIAISAACGIAALFVGFVFMPELIYRDAVRNLAVKAIDNGNMTLEGLRELAKAPSQEVA